MTNICNLVKLSVSSLFAPFLWILYRIQSLVGIYYKKIRKNIYENINTHLLNYARV